MKAILTKWDTKNIQFLKGGSLKYLIVCLFLVFTISVLAKPFTPIGDINNLSAPTLGITSSSAVLLWDDSNIPDYTKPHSEEIERIYYVFKDGEKIGSTKQRTYAVHNLSSSSVYTFSIQLNESFKKTDEEGTEIQIATKETGKIFSIKEFGAVGDGKTVDTKSIQNTIDACAVGGKVIVPAGTYILDHIELKSNMTLELEEGSRLSFLGFNEGGSYPATTTQLSGPDGMIYYQKKYLITGYKVKNVTITGSGVIYGNGETWWPHYKELTVKGGRPFMLGFIQSSNILVQGITFQDPPAWNNHLLYADSVLFSDVKFFQISIVQGHNADGLDADASRNISVVGCTFGTQDDSFAIKSGRYSADENKRCRSSEYITVRDCIFDGTIVPGATTLGLAIGSEVSGGARHILVKNCQFIDVASIINIKTNRNRPYSVVEDVRVENCVYRNNNFPEKPYNRAPLAVDMFYYGKYANPDTFIALNPTTPLFRDIHFKNIHIENNKGKFSYLRGMPEQPIQNMTFENISGSAKEGIFGENIDGINLINVKFKADSTELYTWKNVKKLIQVPDRKLLENNPVYKPYTSSQDTSLTLYANFFVPSKPSPILVWLHGWHGRAKKRSTDDVAPSLSNDWFLIQPDMRGRGDSKGKQDCNGWELQDVIDAVEYAKKTYPALISHPNSIRLLGGSGGGGNVLSLVGKFPDYFSAAVAEFVISDYGLWYRADSIKKEFRDEMETKGWIGGSPQTNPEAYASRGGLTIVENLLTPMAIIHGDRDIRVQVEQSRVYINKAEQVGKMDFIIYLELKGVGAFNGGAHWENASKEQIDARLQLTNKHFIQNTEPIEIPRQGKFVVAGYLKTKHFEVILDSIDRIGEVTYNLDKEEYLLTSKSAKTAKLNIKRGKKWEMKSIKIN